MSSSDPVQGASAPGQRAPAAADHDHHAHPPLSPVERIVKLLAVVVPFAALLAAMVWAWGIGFGWVELTLLATMYVLTGLGITVGYHRYFTHRSFEAPRGVQAALAILGSMAAEGPILRWVACHRVHHRHSDHEGDPHSPHGHGRGLVNAVRGFLHAHVGWIFDPAARDLARHAADLQRDRFVRTMSALFPLWVLLGLLIPAGIAGLVTMSWSGALLGFVWGGLVRIFLVHHVTWSINSVCHIWGTRPFRSRDESRNNAILGVLAFGEGWHNNHHAFPTSARHGLRWWEIDTSFLVIRLLALLGLATNVKVPPRDRLARARR